MLNNPLIFGSRKATVATVGASLITFIMLILPILLPSVAPEVWTETSKLLTQIVSLYLVSQGAVDLAGNLKPNQTIDGQATIDIAPKE